MKTVVVRNIKKMQARICDFLNHSSKSWSIKRLKIYWFFFMLVGAAISLEICVQAIQHSKAIQGISRPHTTILIIPKTFPNYPRERLDFLMARIKEYKKYLDSLYHSDSSKYNVLVHLHPHLMDSINSLETILSQTIQ